MKIKNTKVGQALRAFVEEHAEGWNHNDWLAFLGRLQETGVKGDPEEIGLELERTRLAAVLSERKIKGLGPRRIEAIVDQFGSLWNVRQAKAEDFAAVSNIPSRVAGELEEALAG